MIDGLTRDAAKILDMDFSVFAAGFCPLDSKGRLDGIIGSSAFEGIHPDKDGNLLIVEDAGGATVNVVPYPCHQ